MNEQTLQMLNAAADTFRATTARLQIDKYEVPVNIAAESDHVRAAYEEGRVHDPQLQFVDIDDAAADQVTELAELVAVIDSPWIEPMRTTVQYMADTLADCRTHDAAATTRRTAAMYGSVSDADTVAAAQQLDRPFQPNPEPTDIDAAATVTVIADALHAVHLDEWNVKVESQMNAMMDVSAERREIRIRQGTTFGPTSLTRLLVHEVGCHVFRSASGARQPITLLGLGLGDYLPTEEGFACYLEERTRLTDPVDSRRLALRYVAAAMSLEHGLFDVYAHLRRYADHQQAFETAVRAKRGIGDTSAPGAHLKDKVYFEGIQSVSRHLATNPADVTLLYTGKISLSMLPLIRESTAAGDVTPPAYTDQQIPSLMDAFSATASLSP